MSTPPAKPPVTPPDLTATRRQEADLWPLVIACFGCVIPPLGLVGGGLGVRQMIRARSEGDRPLGLASTIIGFVGATVSSAFYLWIGFLVTSGMRGFETAAEFTRMAVAETELVELDALLRVVELEQGNRPMHPLEVLHSQDEVRVQQVERTLRRLAQDADVDQSKLSIRGISLLGIGRYGSSQEALAEALAAQRAEDAGRGWSQFAIFGVIDPPPERDNMIRMWYARQEGSRVMVLLRGGLVRHVDSIEWGHIQEAENERRRALGLDVLPELPMSPSGR